LRIWWGTSLRNSLTHGKPGTGEHKQAGVGQIGAGITTAPMECFNDALAFLAKKLPSIPEAKEGAA